MTKPDRFDRLVDKVKWGNELDGYFLRPPEIAKLLRAEHRWVRDMVHECLTQAYEYEIKEQGAGRAVTAAMWKSRVAQCQDILIKLKARAK